MVHKNNLFCVTKKKTFTLIKYSNLYPIPKLVFYPSWCACRLLPECSLHGAQGCITKSKITFYNKFQTCDSCVLWIIQRKICIMLYLPRQVTSKASLFMIGVSLSFHCLPINAFEADLPPVCAAPRDAKEMWDASSSEKVAKKRQEGRGRLVCQLNCHALVTPIKVVYLLPAAGARTARRPATRRRTPLCLGERGVSVEC